MTDTAPDPALDLSDTASDPAPTHATAPDPAPDLSDTASDPAPTPPRRWLSWLVRAVVVVALLSWLLRGEGLTPLIDAVRRLSLPSFSLAFALVFLAIALTSLRWRWLMRAFGATRTPRLRTLWRLILVGLFYNTFIPGAVGGDVVRGVVSRDAFEEPAAGLTVVLLDRLTGLSALGVLFLCGLPFAPEALSPVRAAVPWVAGLAVAGLLALILARHSAILSRYWRQAPRVRAPLSLLWALGISFVCHGLSLVAFALFTHSLGLDLGLAVLLVVVPLSMVASFVPVALVGVGPREAAMVGLLGLLGVERSLALALSLGYAGAVILTATLGGLVQLSGRLKLSA